MSDYERVRFIRKSADYDAVYFWEIILLSACMKAVLKKLSAERKNKETVRFVGVGRILSLGSIENLV